MLECYPGIEKTHVFTVLERCMRERCSETLENEFTYDDGSHAWFELRVEACREGLIVLSVDITERKKLEATLRRDHKLRALGQMAAGVAHDLKNVLNPLGLQLELLKRKLPHAAGASEIVDEMAAVLKRGREIVGLLQDFGRQSPATPAHAVELDAIAHEAAQLCRPRATQQGAASIHEELGGGGSIRVSAPELLSALVNLLANAIDAVSHAGRITIRTARNDGGAWVEVEDDGPGMPAEAEARAFEPFFTTKGDGGTGLGLAMVYAFASRHGGQVRLRTAPGEGTTMRLTFPT
jgi:signal transduction histidine kinase